LPMKGVTKGDREKEKGGKKGGPRVQCGERTRVYKSQGGGQMGKTVPAWKAALVVPKSYFACVRSRN